MKKILLWTIVPGIMVIFILISCTSEKPKENKDIKTEVKIAPVEWQTLAKPLHTYGRVFSKKEIRLSFKIGGIIQRIAVEEGQRVKKGQLLAKLNLLEIESQVRQARSVFEKAGRDLDRIKKLYKEKAATLEQHQNIQTYFQVTQSQLKTAEFNLRFSEIRAPSNGRILKRLMEENEITGPGTPLFIFAAAAKDWIIRAGISDRDLIRIQYNDPAVVRFDAYPDKKFKAAVTEIVESADPYTGTYEIELKLNAGDLRLVSGFVADIDIFPSARENYAVIPVEALVTADGSQGQIFAIDPNTNKAREVYIQIQFLFDGKIAVASGLENITHVVTDGASYLTEGDVVSIQTEKD